MSELAIIIEEVRARLDAIMKVNSCNQNEWNLRWSELTQDQIDEVSYLTDELSRYQGRWYYLRGKQVERCPEPKVFVDKRKADTGLYFVTLNPPPEYQNEAFFKLVEDFAELKVVKNATYVFEQRGTVEGDYRGVHCHMLVERAVKPYAFWKEHKRKFSKIFGEENFRTPVWKVDNVEIAEKSKVLRYMSGEKNGFKNKKREKVENDTLFRNQYGLETVYTRPKSC